MLLANLVLLNNFLHDFSAAGWIFCTVLLWQFLKNGDEEKKFGTAVLTFFKTTLLLMRLSFVGIVVFGIGRALAYNSHEWNDAAGDGQILLLIVKHVLLAFVFYAGIIYYRRTKRLIEKEYHEKKQ